MKHFFILLIFILSIPLISANSFEISIQNDEIIKVSRTIAKSNTLNNTNYELILLDSRGDVIDKHPINYAPILRTPNIECFERQIEELDIIVDGVIETILNEKVIYNNECFNIKNEEKVHTSFIPYEPKAVKIELRYEEELIHSYEINHLSSFCGNNICLSYENYFSCPNDCKDIRTIYTSQADIVHGDARFSSNAQFEEVYEQECETENCIRHLQEGTIIETQNNIELRGNLGGEYRLFDNANLKLVDDDWSLDFNSENFVEVRGEFDRSPLNPMLQTSRNSRTNINTNPLKDVTLLEGFFEVRSELQKRGVDIDVSNVDSFGIFVQTDSTNYGFSRQGNKILASVNGRIQDTRRLSEQRQLQQIKERNERDLVFSGELQRFLEDPSNFDPQRRSFISDCWNLLETRNYALLQQQCRGSEFEQYYLIKRVTEYLEKKEYELATRSLSDVLPVNERIVYERLKLSMEINYAKKKCDLFRNDFFNYVTRYPNSLSINKYLEFNNECEKFVEVKEKIDFEDLKKRNVLVLGDISEEELDTYIRDSLFKIDSDIENKVSFTFIEKEVECGGSICDCKDSVFLGQRVGLDSTLIFTEEICESNSLLNEYTIVSLNEHEDYILAYHLGKSVFGFGPEFEITTPMNYAFSNCDETQIQEENFCINGLLTKDNNNFMNFYNNHNQDNFVLGQSTKEKLFG